MEPRDEKNRNFVTAEQLECLEQLLLSFSPEFTLKVLNDLALSPPALGPRTRTALAPFHLNRAAISHLLDFDRAAVKEWAQQLLAAGLTLGIPAQFPHSLTFKAAVECAFKMCQQELCVKREKERATEFTAPVHQAAARRLLLGHMLSPAERLEALRRIIATARGMGPEFRESVSGLTTWQRKAGELSQQGYFPTLKQLREVAEHVLKAPLGLTQPFAPENDFPATFYLLLARERSQQTSQASESHAPL